MVGAASRLLYLALLCEHRYLREGKVTLAQLLANSTHTSPHQLVQLISTLTGANQIRCVDLQSGRPVDPAHPGIDPHQVVVSRGASAFQLPSTPNAVMEAARHLAIEPFNCQDLAALWQRLVIDEAIAYLSMELASHGLDAAGAERVRPLFSQLVSHLALGYLLNLGWVGARDCASAYLRNHSQIEIALKFMVGGMQRRAEAHLSGIRPMKLFRLPSHWHTSTTVSLLKDVATKLGDAYITETPSAEVIMQNRLKPH